MHAYTNTHTHRRAYRVACEDAYRRNETIRTFNLNAVPKNKTKKKHKIKYMHNHDTSSSSNNNVRVDNAPGTALLESHVTHWGDFSLFLALSTWCESAMRASAPMQCTHWRANKSRCVRVCVWYVLMCLFPFALRFVYCFRKAQSSAAADVVCVQIMYERACVCVCM